MPIQTIRDPKTGEERRVYVSSGGMGTGAPPKPRPQPQPPAGGGFMGTLNDFNPMKQIGALGTGVSTFLQTGGPERKHCRCVEGSCADDRPGSRSQSGPGGKWPIPWPDCSDRRSRRSGHSPDRD